MGVAIIIGLSHLIVAVVVAAIALPLVKGQIAPNKYHGCRYAVSYSSPEAWYDINRHGGRLLLRWALFLVLGTLVLMALNPTPGSRLFFIQLWLPLIFLVPAFQNWRYARRKWGK